MILLRAVKFDNANCVTLVDGAKTSNDDYMDVFVESEPRSTHMKMVVVRFSSPATDFSKKVIQYLQEHDARIVPVTFIRGETLMVSGVSRPFHYRHLPTVFSKFVHENIITKRNTFAEILRVVQYRKKLCTLRKAFKHVEAYDYTTNFTTPKITINNMHTVLVYKSSYDIYIALDAYQDLHVTQIV
jgi:hypothetical protein